MSKKRKTLPGDFETLLKEGDLAKLKAVFETCEPDARGGAGKKTALAFAECPDDLTRWLVAHGANLSAEDAYGRAPLHSRASDWRGRFDVLVEIGADLEHGEGAAGTALHGAAGAHHVDHVRRLITHGANINALDRAGFSPLESALRRCANPDIVSTAVIAGMLLDAGARRTSRSSDFVARIGTNFEFHRTAFNRDLMEAASTGLDRLYELFGVPPVARRRMHDGVSPIEVRSGRWQDQHQELWDFLVPSSYAAATVQGEVIRISGKIARELDGNGGVNWDDQFQMMAGAWLAHVASGMPLPPAELEEASKIVREIRCQEDMSSLCKLSVAWVALNSMPVRLATPPYAR